MSEALLNIVPSLVVKSPNGFNAEGMTKNSELQMREASSQQDGTATDSGYQGRELLRRSKSPYSTRSRRSECLGSEKKRRTLVEHDAASRAWDADDTNEAGPETKGNSKKLWFCSYLVDADRKSLGSQVRLSD